MRKTQFWETFLTIRLCPVGKGQLLMLTSSSSQWNPSAGISTAHAELLKLYATDRQHLSPEIWKSSSWMKFQYLFPLTNVKVSNSHSEGTNSWSRPGEAKCPSHLEPSAFIFCRKKQTFKIMYASSKRQCTPPSRKPRNYGQKSQEMTQLVVYFFFLSSICPIYVSKDSIQRENS